jgi:hypothetical protein
VADTCRRWEAAQTAALAGAKPQGRPTKPEDLTRLHETLMYNSNELAELAGNLKGRAGEALADVAGARSAAAAAGRCYWVAHTYLAGDRWGEAAALFGRAQQRVAEAVEKLEVGVVLGEGGDRVEGSRAQLGTMVGAGVWKWFLSRGCRVLKFSRGM